MRGAINMELDINVEGYDCTQVFPGEGVSLHETNRISVLRKI